MSGGRVKIISKVSSITAVICLTKAHEDYEVSHKENFISKEWKYKTLVEALAKYNELETQLSKKESA